MRPKLMRKYLGFLYNEECQIVYMSGIYDYRGDCKSQLLANAKRLKRISFACINHYESGRTEMLYYRFSGSQLRKCDKEIFFDFNKQFLPF